MFAFVSVASFSIPALSASLAESDQDLVSDQFHRMNLPGTGQSLHLSTYTFADGVKGKRMNIIDENPAIRGDGKYKNNEEEIFHSQICSADVIEMATLSSSEAFLSKGKDTIFTVNQFQPSDVIKQKVTLNTAQPMLVANVGGDVVDENEKLRMEVVNNVKMKNGDSYLLFLAQ